MMVCLRTGSIPENHAYPPTYLRRSAEKRYSGSGESTVFLAIPVVIPSRIRSARLRAPNFFLTPMVQYATGSHSLQRIFLQGETTRPRGGRELRPGTVVPWRGLYVISAKAGIHSGFSAPHWTPAFAGVTWWIALGCQTRRAFILLMLPNVCPEGNPAEVS